MGNDRIEERYEAFIRNSSEGIWLAELDKSIPTDLDPMKQVKMIFKHAFMAEANDAMAAMYAVPSKDMLIGARINQLIVESDPQNTEYLLAFVKSGYKLNGVESHELDNNGNQKIFRNSLVGIIEDGKLMRAWGTQHDITEQYLANQALKESEERLARALNASNMGLWEWDMVTRDLVWSDELKILYGLETDVKITYEKYVSMLHPDDRKHMDAVVKKAIKSGQEYVMEHRVVWPDKSVHWVTGRGKAYYENGKPVKMVGTCNSIQDIKRKAELEQLNLELIAQREELEKLNKSKDEFISLASHQLRTPATAVKQYLGIVLEGYAGGISKQQSESLEKAYVSNERQLSIINDLLRVAQLDAGKVNLAKTKTELIGFLKKIIADQEGKFKAKKQKVRINSPHTKIYAMIDQDRMYMALENIIGNASKYSANNTEIIIAVLEEDGSAKIRVVDQGIGIRKKDVSRLFQKFARLEDPRTGEVTGTGLGLYWANRIVMLHGGSIALESKLRKGSTFIIIIPSK